MRAFLRQRYDILLDYEWLRSAMNTCEGTPGTAQVFDQLRKDYRVRRELAGSSLEAGELDFEPCELLSALGCDLRESNK